MKNIQIYTTENCPFCIKAKNLLRAKGVEFEEINIKDDEAFILNKLAERSGIYTVPQIYVNQKFVGDCDSLYQLERQNKLDEVLK